MSQLSGKVQTVLGLVDPDQLGRTMTHEHLTMSFECCYFPPPAGDEAVAKDPFHMQYMHWLRQNPYACHENLLLQQETAAVRDELLLYRKAGGGTIVENTTTGIDRDLPTLRQMAKDTGVHIVAGAGYYVDCTHTEATKKMSVEKVWLSLRASVDRANSSFKTINCRCIQLCLELYNSVTRQEERPASVCCAFVLISSIPSACSEFMGEDFFCISILI